MSKETQCSDRQPVAATAAEVYAYLTRLRQLGGHDCDSADRKDHSAVSHACKGKITESVDLALARLRCEANSKSRWLELICKTVMGPHKRCFRAGNAACVVKGVPEQAGASTAGWLDMCDKSADLVDLRDSAPQVDLNHLMLVAFRKPFPTAFLDPPAATDPADELTVLAESSLH